jgi:nitrite reductase/ring-hydroxylating ferredoxin subunit
MNGYRDQEEPIEAVAVQLDALVRAFESHADEQVRRDVFALLEHVDALHRAGLTRLIAAVRAAGAGAALTRALADPAVRLLLELYDLLPEEAPATADLIPLTVVGAPRTPPGFVPMSAIRLPPKPPEMEWHDAVTVADIPEGGIRPVAVAGRRLLLCRVDGEVYVVRDSCAGSGLPLAAGELVGGELRCPWHHCRYDVRTGRRIAGTRGDLATFPVSIANGVVRVGVPAESGAPAGR